VGLRRHAGLVALVMLLALPASAAAAAPTLRAVGQANGAVSATWSLAAGQQSLAIEVATSPVTDADGLFLDANAADGDVLDPGATSWLSSVQLTPGTYYVHVSSVDDPGANVLWSNVLSVVIPSAPTLETAPTSLGVASTGAGTISSGPAGITCSAGAPSGCSTTFAAGTAVTLTATPAAGGTFQHWLGDVCAASSSVTCSFVVGASAISVTGSFGAADGSAPAPSITPTGDHAFHIAHATAALGRAQLSFSLTAGGPSRKGFPMSEPHVYVAVRWLAVPGSKARARLIWIRPSGRQTKSATLRPGERVGDTVTAAISHRLVRGRAGRWTVELKIGGKTVSTASFAVHETDPTPLPASDQAPLPVPVAAG
jgi:hypothetical protein